MTENTSLLRKNSPEIQNNGILKLRNFLNNNIDDNSPNVTPN